jgi:putative transcriptional regulator
MTNNSKVNEKKINFDLIKNATRYRLDEVDVNEIVNGAFVKTLRDKLNMSQNVFASMLGVSEKTVEKWEQGKHKIKGPNARLLYLLNKDPSLIKHWYRFGKVNNDTNQIEDCMPIEKKINDVIDDFNKEKDLIDK